MIKQLLSQFTKQLLPLSLGTICILAIANLQSSEKTKLLETTQSKNTYLQQEEGLRLKLSLLQKTPAFGFDNLVADWTMLQFLQYFGDGEARDITGYSLCADYLDIIVENDPLFSRAYTIISPASSMFAGTPERTIAAMNRGLAQMPSTHPDGYFIWLYKGVDEILFMGDLSAAEKSYRMSAQWAKESGNERIVASANDTIKFLASKPDVRQAQANVWFLVWSNNKDVRIRRLAEARITSLGGQFAIDANGTVSMIPPKINES